MSDELRALIERARRADVSDADAEEQRRSFAYGNLRLEDARVTRADIDRAAAALKSKSHSR